MKRKRVEDYYNNNNNNCNDSNNDNNNCNDSNNDNNNCNDSNNDNNGKSDEFIFQNDIITNILLERLKLDIVKCNIIQHGNFILKSGAKSSVYIDFKKLICYPTLNNNVCDNLFNLFSSTNVTVLGVPMGAINLAANISSRHNIPMLLMRPFQKDHGTKKLIEGETFGKECVVIEDVMTTGGSVLSALKEMKRHGIKVKQVIAIMDREKGAKQLLEGHGYNVRSLFRLSDFI